MRGKKNDFSMTFFNYHEKALHLQYVHNTETAERWTDSKNIKWTHANIYDRRKGEFLKRIYHHSIGDVRQYLVNLNSK